MVVIFPREFDESKFKIEKPAEDEHGNIFAKATYAGEPFEFQNEEPNVLPFGLSGPYKQKPEKVMEGGKYGGQLNLPGWNVVGTPNYYLYNMIATIEKIAKEVMIRDEWFNFPVTPEMLKIMFVTMLKNSEHELKKKKPVAPTDGKPPRVYDPSLAFNVNVKPNDAMDALILQAPIRDGETGEVVEPLDRLKAFSKFCKTQSVFRVPHFWLANGKVGGNVRLQQGKVWPSETKSGGWRMREDSEPQAKKQKTDEC
jgi:hypothetical protein